MQTEISIYIIKPEAIQYRENIHKIIMSSGLIILSYKQTVLPSILAEKIYLDCSDDIIEATRHFMFKDICEVGLVTGDNPIEQLIEICGTETDPKKCKTGTIRNLFGFHELQFYNETGYYQNAIHRPKTKVELEKDLILLKEVISLDSLVVKQNPILPPSGGSM